MRTIVIGCGSTIENAWGGPVRYYHESGECGNYPHALHIHTNCTTVDIDARCNPSVVLDFTASNYLELIHKLGREKFDLIVLENLPYRIYREEYKFRNLVKNCHYILSEIGQVFIPLVQGEEVERVEWVFSRLCFRLIHASYDFSRIYPIISAFTGRYADEFIMRNTSHCLLEEEMDFFYLVFKR